MKVLESREEDLLASAPFGGVLRLPPTNSLVATRGTILLVHGFALSANAYRELASLWCVAGYAVYVPAAIYSVCTPVGDEIPALISAASWAYEHLPKPTILAGHSRGGQAALNLMLQITKGPVTTLPLAFSGCILLDPVEGKPTSFFNPSLTHTLLAPDAPKWTWNKNIPCITIATKHGGCAPKGFDARAIHEALLKANVITESTSSKGTMRRSRSKGPFYFLNAPTFGHLDFLDDNPVGIVPTLAQWLLPSGGRSKRHRLRKLCRDAVDAVFAAEDPSTVRERFHEVQRRMEHSQLY